MSVNEALNPLRQILPSSLRQNETISVSEWTPAAKIVAKPIMINVIRITKWRWIVNTLTIVPAFRHQRTDVTADEVVGRRRGGVRLRRLDHVRLRVWNATAERGWRHRRQAAAAAARATAAADDGCTGVRQCYSAWRTITERTTNTAVASVRVVVL